jgi:uncharacterized protein DUF4136
VKGRCVSIVAVALMAFACSPRIYIRTDSDKTANFSRYRTVAVREGNSSGDPVMDRRIVNDVAQALQAKGYRIAPEDEADAVVVEHAATRDKHTYETFYAGAGWGWRRGWRWGLGAPIVTEYDFTVGTLVVDMFDASTKEAVWHGSARGLVSGDPEKDAAEIQRAITKLFQRLPTRTLA